MSDVIKMSRVCLRFKFFQPARKKTCGSGKHWKYGSDRCWFIRCYTVTMFDQTESKIRRTQCTQMKNSHRNLFDPDWTKRETHFNRFFRVPTFTEIWTCTTSYKSRVPTSRRKGQGTNLQAKSPEWVSHPSALLAKCCSACQMIISTGHHLWQE